MGVEANAAHSGASAFGGGATTTRPNQMVFGRFTNAYSAPGVTSAASLAAQSGPLEG